MGKCRAEGGVEKDRRKKKTRKNLITNINKVVSPDNLFNGGKCGLGRR